MTAGHWRVPSFRGRGTRTAHYVIKPGSIAACGRRVGGYGNTAPAYPE